MDSEDSEDNEESSDSGQFRPSANNEVGSETCRDNISRASSARIYSNETGRYSSAELDRNVISRRGFYSPQSFYSCVNCYSAPLHQTGSFESHVIYAPESHEVRAMISVLEQECHSSLQNTDTSFSISSCSSYVSIYSLSSVCLPDSPHDSQGSVAQASNWYVALHRIESNAEKEFLSEGAVSSGDVQFQAPRSLSDVKADESLHVRFCEHVIVAMPPQGSFIDSLGLRCSTDTVVKDDVLKVVPVHQIDEFTTAPSDATRVLYCPILRVWVVRCNYDDAFVVQLPNVAHGVNTIK